MVLQPGVAEGETVTFELREFVRGSLAPYKCPKSIRLVDSLPKKATGKLKRFELRKRAASRR
ncbi:MAG TPA: hypothetical protein VEZ11_16350 [Thermoanaerobaculia bacterium]|nr:hypothetical protein [Thermoanaerobaculia bacterium]